MEDTGDSRDSRETEAREDSREHARQPIELKVEYKRLNSFFSDYTRNISKGGTFIKTSKPLDIGTEFVFKLYVPRLEEPLRIAGRVHWVVTQEDIEAGKRMGPGEPGMGIRFVYRDDWERVEIEQKIERVMAESLGPQLSARLIEQSKAGAGAADGPTHFAGQTDTFGSPRGADGDSFGALVRRWDK